MLRCGGRKEAVDILKLTDIDADQLTHLVGVSLQLSLQLLHLPLELPSASLAPGPGVYLVL